MPDEHDLKYWEPPPSGQKETSRKAALTVLPKAGTYRRRVYDAILAAGDKGLTREEVETAAGMPGSTVRPRVLELMKMGLVQEISRARKTKSGHDALVLIARSLPETSKEVRDGDDQRRAAEDARDGDAGNGGARTLFG